MRVFPVVLLVKAPFTEDRPIGLYLSIIPTVDQMARHRVMSQGSATGFPLDT
jgi:hypothetical protein